MSSYKIVYSELDYSTGGNHHIQMCESLEEKVDKLMKQGWSCVGGVCAVSSEGITNTLYQAMVRLPA